MPRITLLTLAIFVLTADAAHARPAHKQALAQYFGPHLPKKLNDCRTCHLPDAPGAALEEGDKPHNLFGQRLKDVRDELRKAGKQTTLDARLDAILQEDTDRDGAVNLVELLTGHNPGEKDDRPAAAELADVKKLLVAFTKFRTGYPWKPFEVVQRPAVPEVKNRAWVRNPIDAFIAAEHEALGVKPRPEATKPVLLRRLYIDLIGLPPTPEELHAFLKDTSVDAYEKVVDRLLASPHYGERWGRHWMDVWRYSDWAGYGPQVRDSKPHIWRWRDWIVDSLNEDRGYDRMILEMLAGDELAPEDTNALAATGYLVRTYKLLSREKWMQDTVEHTFMAFQGMTLGCAKCHDHMYDPILQTDYYQVRAIFEPHQVRTDRLPGKPDPKIDGLVRAYDADLAAPTYFFIRGDDRTPDKNKKILPGVPEAWGSPFPEIAPVPLPRGAVFPDQRDFVIDDILNEAGEDLAKTQNAIQQKIVQGVVPLVEVEPYRRLLALALTRKPREELPLAVLDAQLAQAKAEALQKVLAVEALEDKGIKEGDAWKQAATAAALIQRRVALLDAQKKIALAQQKLAALPAAKALVAKKELAEGQKALAKADADAKQPPGPKFTRRAVTTYPAQSSGRRLALARWLADRENPLTARVAVNHIWLRHFGQGIVPSVFDFGRNGRPPSHPALLDWLAAEFMQPTQAPGLRPRGSWTMKHLHRLMVTSSTYRLASTPDDANTALDRDNKYLWRHNSRRVEAEVVRDALFHVAGRLDLTRGGPDIDYPLGLTVPRRSLYFRHAAEKQMEFLLIFDTASVNECYERKQAIVPGQALALLNSDLTLKNARLLARDLSGKTEPAAFVTRAFEKVLSRPPTEAELKECTTFLADQTRYFHESKTKSAGPSADGSLPAPEPVLRARENLVHVLMNHHEFVTIR